VVTVGVQGMADGVWVRAFDFIRQGGIGHVAHAQGGVFRNDVRGQWRFYRLAREMTPKTVDWDLFLGHRFEMAGTKLGPTPKEQPFDRAAFAQWRTLWAFSGGPFADLLTHPVARLSAAMGVKFPARVTAGGGLYLEYDGRDVPDVGTVVADYEEGCHLVLTGATITGYPVEEVIRGRLGTVKFVKGGFQVYRDDPTRGATFPPRLETPMLPSEVVSVEPPRNETEVLWENFLACMQSRQQSTYCPPDLGAAAVAVTAMAARSYRTGQALFWNRERREVVEADSTWGARWESRSKSHSRPNQVFGWSAGDTGSTLTPPTHQNLAGPWANGKEPA
jgi:predicted dehydrogenase